VSEPPPPGFPVPPGTSVPSGIPVPPGTSVPPGIPASDAERDAAAEKLADAVAAGRLSLADHGARLEALFAAKTSDEVEAVTADLPARAVRKSGLYRSVDAYRCVIIGGAIQRTGRFTIGRFCAVNAAFGQLDLDLRTARPSQREIDLTIWSVLSTVSITVPHSWGLTDKTFVLGKSRTTADREASSHAPILRIRGACLGGSFRLTQA
jgi:hypothetical protein